MNIWQNLNQNLNQVHENQTANININRRFLRNFKNK